jgi:hypothetical protein
MESVVLIVPSTHEVDLIRRVESLRPSPGLPGVFVVEDGVSSVFVGRNDFVPHEIGPQRLAAISSLIRSPVFYTVDFSEIGNCRRVLGSIANESWLLVDNDHGVVSPGAEYVARMRARPAWDWRLDTDWPRDDD